MEKPLHVGQISFTVVCRERIKRKNYIISIRHTVVVKTSIVKINIAVFKECEHLLVLVFRGEIFIYLQCLGYNALYVASGLPVRFQQGFFIRGLLYIIIETDIVLGSCLFDTLTIIHSVFITNSFNDLLLK